MTTNLVAETLRGGLFTRLVGKRLLYFQEVSSTMDEALRRAERGTDEGTVVVAETQTASRGRHGRAWVSRSGNLYLSIVLYPDLATLPHLNSLCGVAVVRAITHISGLKPRIKWPNDILLDGKKVAGILVESAIAGSAVRSAIIALLADGSTYTIAQIASSLSLSRRRIDPLIPSLLANNQAIVAGHAGRSRTFRNPP